MYSALNLGAKQPVSRGPTRSDAPAQDVEVVPVHQAVHSLCAPGSSRGGQVPPLGRGQLGVLVEHEVVLSCVSLSLTNLKITVKDVKDYGVSFIDCFKMYVQLNCEGVELE